MPDKFFLILESRAVLAVSGEDRRSFLQGLISNDVGRVAADRAIYAAFLTAQGRFLHDLFVFEQGGRLLLDCESVRRDDLRRRLSLYRLRARVAIEADDGWAVAACFGAGALAALELAASAPGAARAEAGGAVYVDPRLAALGARAMLPRVDAAERLAALGFRPGSFADYERLRISLGVPDGSRDLAVEKALLLENGFDELHGVDWNKGCYVGQELTARMKYRALVKKRLLPVRIDGPPPAPGTPVTFGAEEAGEMRSVADGLGLALLRIELVESAQLQAQPLVAGEAKLTPMRPAWAQS